MGEQYDNFEQFRTCGRLVPVFGVFLSAMLLSEELHLAVWPALTLVVAGIVIVNGNRASEKVIPQTESIKS
ncbi:hypothetical protein [Cohnella terricola]|uniref:EamA domain-containing protein n=1 Tax=Cohnella terricola TaxID=1289167 RepID=A0A559JC29_9BACL|nr:hypothetical protein [Cohnella terricola]TVX97422.1 hypothetical protein FPZ45_19010 [Cohnella terricola]